ncbi:MAG: response regulator [Oscillospiraceae bacterium]|nr:response regulator [Oscillospiraceae bacterium]
MHTICVDDERQTLEETLALCQKMPQITSVKGFTNPREALRWAEDNPVELAILDIHMPGMDGLTLGRSLREQNGKTAILFVTSQPQYAVDAWSLHPTGFVLKPLTRERLSDELEYALEWRARMTGETATARVEVKTFGNFDLVVDGRKISFARSKAKELLACLIDKRGIRMTRAEAFHRLWGEEEYTRSRQKMLDVIIRSLRKTLEDNGVGEILKIEQGTLRIVPETIDCDLYRLLGGDENTMREYQGEYMSAYTWASGTEGRIETKLRSLAALQA